MTIEKVEVGAMWEGYEWEIRHDCDVSEWNHGDNVKPCPHCHSRHETVIKGDGYEWVCPRVAVAYNEGGYASTGICIDCILAKVAKP